MKRKDKERGRETQKDIDRRDTEKKENQRDIKR